MTDPALWISLAGLALTIVALMVTLITGWVRVNTRIATVETKAAADKVACDTSLQLIRTEGVAIEARAMARTNDLSALITRMDGKVDRLLERHS